MSAFKEEAASFLAKALDWSTEQAQAALEIPKDLSKGDLAFPCFRLAKERKMAPPKFILSLICAEVLISSSAC